MGTIKKAKASSKGGKIVKGIKKFVGGGSSGQKKKSHGVAYYQNKVLKERLKKKLMKIKYGGR